MSTIYFQGDAEAVSQVDTLTIGGTIEADDIFTITIGNKSVETVGGSTTASECATAVKVALAGLDSTLYPEFKEITWTDGTGGTYTATGATPGVPFELTPTTTETDGGAADAQTHTRATVAGQGPNDWATAQNWSGGAVPVASDVVILQNTNRDILYGLSRDVVAYTSGGTAEIIAGDVITGATGAAVAVVVSLTLDSGTWGGGDAAGDLTIKMLDGTFEAEDLNTPTQDNIATIGGASAPITLGELDIKQSFLGDLGLPRSNTSSSAVYFNYLDQYLVVGATLLTIGEGEGSGSGRLKVDTRLIATAITIHNSGVRKEPDVPAIVWKGTHASNTLTVHKGDVGVAIFPGEVATIATLTVGFLNSVLGDSQVVCGSGVSVTTIRMTGGRMDFDLTTAAPTSITVDGGELTLRGDTNGTTTLTINNGGTVFDLGGSGTITTTHLHGTYDHSRSTTARTHTNMSLYEGFVYRDPHGVVTSTNGHDFVNTRPGDPKNVFETADNKTWTESAI